MEGRSLGLVGRQRHRVELRVPIRARDRLLCDSFAMADQPRSLDRSRLGDGPLTTLSGDELAELERALLGVLGIGFA